MPGAGYFCFVDLETFLASYLDCYNLGNHIKSTTKEKWKKELMKATNHDFWFFITVSPVFKC